ncbi:MAG: hypothetical protein KAJ75_02920 [Alphaproteobacteria bacterium]|nr:hypothetical protein [Alphaproteobacteria bacterium]
MKLSYKKIPEEFLEVLPKGMRFLNKGGRDFLVFDELYCPNGHNLMDKNILIHGEPSIRITLDTGLSKGFAYIDAFWGGHEKLFDFIPVLSPESRIVTASCPTCGESLMVNKSCEQENCNSSKSFAFILPDEKSKVYACAKIQCPGHSIEIANVEQKLTKQIDCINFFGGIEDDVFQWI